MEARQRLWRSSWVPFLEAVNRLDGGGPPQGGSDAEQAWVQAEGAKVERLLAGTGGARGVSAGVKGNGADNRGERKENAEPQSGKNG